MSIFRIPVSPEHVRTFKDPNHPKIRIVHALVNVSGLPEDIPLDPDPRVPKVKGRITKRISESLKTNDGRFHLLNRGITLSVESVEFDGVFEVSQRIPIANAIEDILLLAECSLEGEWEGQLRFLPLR